MSRVGDSVGDRVTDRIGVARGGAGCAPGGPTRGPGALGGLTNRPPHARHARALLAPRRRAPRRIESRARMYIGLGVELKSSSIPDLWYRLKSAKHAPLPSSLPPPPLLLSFFISSPLPSSFLPSFIPSFLPSFLTSSFL